MQSSSGFRIKYARYRGILRENVMGVVVSTFIMIV